MSEKTQGPEKKTAEYKISPETARAGIVLSLAGVVDFDIYSMSEGQYIISGNSSEVKDLITKITPDHSLEIGRNYFGEDKMPRFENSSSISRNHVEISMDDEDNLYIEDRSLNGIEIL